MKGPFDQIVYCETSEPLIGTHAGVQAAASSLDPEDLKYWNTLLYSLVTVDHPYPTLSYSVSDDRRQAALLYRMSETDNRNRPFIHILIGPSAELTPKIALGSLEWNWMGAIRKRSQINGTILEKVDGEALQSFHAAAEVGWESVAKTDERPFEVDWAILDIRDHGGEDRGPLPGDDISSLSSLGESKFVIFISPDPGAVDEQAAARLPVRLLSRLLLRLGRTDQGVDAVSKRLIGTGFSTHESKYRSGQETLPRWVFATREDSGMYSSDRLSIDLRDLDRSAADANTAEVDGFSRRFYAAAKLYAAQPTAKQLAARQAAAEAEAARVAEEQTEAARLTAERQEAKRAAAEQAEAQRAADEAEATRAAAEQADAARVAAEQTEAARLTAERQEAKRAAAEQAEAQRAADEKARLNFPPPREEKAGVGAAPGNIPGSRLSSVPHPQLHVDNANVTRSSGVSSTADPGLGTVRPSPAQQTNPAPSEEWAIYKEMSDQQLIQELDQIGIDQFCSMIHELKLRTTSEYQANRQKQGKPVNVVDIRKRLIRSNFHIADLDPFPESYQHLVTELYCALCDFAASDQMPGNFTPEFSNSFLDILANNNTYRVRGPGNVPYSPLARAIIRTLTAQQDDPQETRIPHSMAPYIVPSIGHARLHYLGIPIEVAEKVDNHSQRPTSDVKSILSSRQDLIVIAAVVTTILAFVCIGFFA